VGTSAGSEHGDHPLTEAAQRAALAAGERARTLAALLDRLRSGSGTSVAEALQAESSLEVARRRQHEARRRLVTTQLARAHHVAAHQDFLAVARRLARRTLAEEVRDKPLEP